jgi:hypothetical protein
MNHTEDPETSRNLVRIFVDQLGMRASIGHMTRKVHADADAGQHLHTTSIRPNTLETSRIMS